jgi:hypothetical protein
MNFRLVFALAAALAFGSLAAADLTITYTATAKGLGKGGTEIQYFTPKFHLTSNEEAKTEALVDFEKGISYTIDHKKKTIQMLRMEDALDALEGLNQAQPEAMAGIMAGMFGNPNEVKVEKLDREQVAGRDCQKYLITVGKLSMALSADPTLKQPMPDASYMRMIQARAATMAKAGPLGASFKRLYEEMAKIKGVALKTDMKGFMGMRVTSEATKVDQSAIAGDRFTLPAGYKMEDQGKKLREELKAK